MLPHKRQLDACKGGDEIGKSRKLFQDAASVVAGNTASAVSGGGAAGKPGVVILVDKSVRANDARRRLAQECGKKWGSFVVLQERSPEQCPHSGPAVTHLVLGSSTCPPADGDSAAAAAARRATRERLAPVLARWPGLVLLDEAWLTVLLSSQGRARELPPTAGFELQLDGDGGRGRETGTAAGTAGRLGSAAGPRAPPPEGKYELWLGRWSPELDDLDDVAIMLQATFNDLRCARIGNSAIVAGLRELKQYELAVREAGDVAGTRALAYARAAAAVQACAFRITGDMPESLLTRLLPFVSLSCARVISQLAQSGGEGCGCEGGGGGARATCDRLEQFRRDLPVRDGDGGLRPGSAGAASRRRLCKLFGVGPATAQLWYDKGCRTLGDALAAVRAGRLCPPSAAVAWGLERHEQLTADVAPNEVAEMVAAVRAALAATTPLPAADWVVQLVGGGRRGRASHDVDLMISHPGVADQDEMGEHFDAAVEWLLRAGHMLPVEGFKPHRCPSAAKHVRKTIESLSLFAKEPGEEGGKAGGRHGISDGNYEKA